MIYLLDVNLLIALAWPSHIHHESAHQWFKKQSFSRWATCPMTQCGFVRISSNPKIIPDAVNPIDAVNMLKKIVSHKKHTFWQDEISIMDPLFSLHDLLFGYRQVTDIYLLGLAVNQKGKLATLDKKIAVYASINSRFENALEIVPV